MKRLAKFVTENPQDVPQDINVVQIFSEYTSQILEVIYIKILYIFLILFFLFQRKVILLNIFQFKLLYHI